MAKILQFLSRNKASDKECVFNAFRPDIRPEDTECILWWGMPVWHNVLKCHGIKMNGDRLRVALNHLANDSLALFHYFQHYDKPTPYVYVSEKIKDKLNLSLRKSLRS